VKSNGGKQIVSGGGGDGSGAICKSGRRQAVDTAYLVAELNPLRLGKLRETEKPVPFIGKFHTTILRDEPSDSLSQSLKAQECFDIQ
jgi:hypothetical protein